VGDASDGPSAGTRRAAGPARAPRRPRSEGSFPLLLEELEAAEEEEARVAQEEVRVQREEIERLTSAAQARRWQHERLLSVLPSPVIVTDGKGTIRSLNASAAALLRMRVHRALRRPIQSLIHEVDRGAVAGALSRAVREGDGFRKVLSLTPVGADAPQLEAVAIAQRDPLTKAVDVSWLLLSGRGHQALEPEGDGLATVAAALVELTLLPVHTGERPEILGAAARICQQTIGASASLSLTVGEPTDPERVASSSKLAQLVDGAQMRAGQGPCQLAWERRRPVVSPDVRADGRWPALAEGLGDTEVRGVVGVPILVGEDLVGVVNVYSPDSQLAPAQVLLVELLASAVGAIVYELDVKDDLKAAAEHLQNALASRATIDRAKGIIMARERCSADQAFQRLVELSNRYNTKLRAVARALVAQAARPDLDPTGVVGATAAPDVP
jgi:GAF domain-containing protein